MTQAITAESYLERILQAISEMLAETLDSAVKGQGANILTLFAPLQPASTADTTALQSTR